LRPTPATKNIRSIFGDMKTYYQGRIPVYLWAENIEPGGMEQIQNLANFPFAVPHIAIMPDCHAGYGMPIGGVMATREVIVPNAVGVDIGCGMCASRTALEGISKRQLEIICNRLRALIPVGFKHHMNKLDNSLMPVGYDKERLPIVAGEWENARYQIGTLGGGNHFIEIQKGSDGYIWVMVHSGSRNLGKQVADYYNKTAILENESQNSPVERARQLAYLYIESTSGSDYMQEMNFCLDFAFANRRRMMETAIDAICNETGSRILPYEHKEMINIAHNYAAAEEHFGETRLVHRKGATRAMKGETGIIPGSQGAFSYIVSGKGEPYSFNSCSHGAGRVLGRNQARRQLNLEDEIRNLDALGILHSIKNTDDLDEAPGAYKNILEVMQLQADLTEIRVELRPLAVIKG